MKKIVTLYNIYQKIKTKSQREESLRPDICMRTLYPQILPITHLEIGENTSQLNMPTPVRASYDYMDSNEVYFIENGIISFIWIGSRAPHQFISDVFNATSLQHLNTESHVLPERDNDRNRAVRRLAFDVVVFKSNLRCKKSLDDTAAGSGVL